MQISDNFVTSYFKKANRENLIDESLENSKEALEHVKLSLSIFFNNHFNMERLSTHKYFGPDCKFD